MKNKNWKTSIKKRFLTLIDAFQVLPDKLSQREKRMIFTLLAIIVAVLYYTQVMTPNLDNISEIQAKLEETTFQYEKMKKDIAKDNPIHREYKTAFAKALFLSQEMFTNFDQERIIILLDDMLKSSGLNALNISFGEPTIVTLKEETVENEQTDMTLLDEIMQQYLGQNEPEKEKDNAENNDKSYQIKKMEVAIQYKSSYPQIKSFIEKVEDNPKKIMISKLDMAADDTGYIIGSMVLDLFYVPTFAMEEQEDFQWIYDNTYGKENPFNYYASTGTSQETIEKSVTKPEDFLITVKPITADLPTVMILQSNDTEMKSHVYADNEGIEPVEFEMIQEGQQYYYRYKTTEESYPKNYEEKIPFTPRDNVVDIQILSSERNSSDDNSGIQLKIINKTDLKCIVNINNDDENRKRVHFEMPFGDVTILE